MDPISQLVDNLKLTKHPEGGYYREVYRSVDTLAPACLSSKFDGERNLSTSIYFLLPSNERSVFHRIKSDELWFFHEGSSLSIFVIEHDVLSILKVGKNVELGEQLQAVIPANSWFGAIVNELNSYVLCSCVVAPGFDFNDFEIANRAKLLDEFPEYQKEIVLLTT